MTTEISMLLAAAAERAVPVVQGVRDDQLGAPTPCSEFQVRDLLNHFHQVVVNFQVLASRQEPDFSSTPDVITGDWRGDFARQTDRLVEAWADPSALEGVSPGMGLPQQMVANLVLTDLTVHAWDLAQATGQPFVPVPAAVQQLLPFAQHMAPQGRDMGVFGPEKPAPPGAGDFERLLAVTGRRV